MMRQEPEKIPDLKVNERLTNAHSLIQESIAVLKAMRSRNPPMYEKTRHRLDVNVEPESEARAFRVLDALFKALETEGHLVRINNRHKTELVVLNESIEVNVRERKDKVPHVTTDAEIARARREAWYKIPSTDQIPTGDLTIKLDTYTDGCRKSWSDGKTQRLEDILSDVYVGILTVADTRRAQRYLREQEWRMENETAIHAAEIRLQREQDQNRFEMLLSFARSHHDRTLLREFIRDVENSTSLRSDLRTKSLMSSWLGWAREKLVATDPVDKIIGMVVTDEW